MSKKIEGRVLGRTLCREQMFNVAGGETTLPPVTTTPTTDSTYAGYDWENSFAGTDSSLPTYAGLDSEVGSENPTTPYY